MAVDGGRLKLEYGILQSRPPEQVNDFLWIAERDLIGFLGIYGYRSDQAEICGMVHPSARRRGIFSRLFEAATAELVTWRTRGTLGRGPPLRVRLPFRRDLSAAPSSTPSTG